VSTEAKERFLRAMANDSARNTLAEFIRERYQEKVDGLMGCTKETFELQKGRAAELKDLLDLINAKK
jgi:hypothetical protein